MIINKLLIPGTISAQPLKTTVILYKVKEKLCKKLLDFKQA